MGAGGSAGVGAAIAEASADELKATVAGLSAEDRARIAKALSGVGTVEGAGDKAADAPDKSKMAAMPVAAVMSAGWYGKQETTHTFVKTPADYSMQFEDVAFPAMDGANISAWYIPSKSKNTKKLAIVGHQSWSEANRSGCIEHFKGGSLKVEAIDYVKLHKVLHDDGFHVIAYDLRNHGKSEHKMPSGYGEIEYQDAVGVMDFVNHHAELKDCKVCLLPFCVSGQSFLKANSLYPDKFKNVVAWATTNIFQLKHMIGTMGLTATDVDPVFAAKQAECVEQGLLKADNPDIQFTVERISAMMYAKDVKVPVLFCDPINDFIDNHKVSAPEIFAEFGKSLPEKPANEFHFIGTDQPAPFNTSGDNRSEGYNFYSSDAGSKVLLEFLLKAFQPLPPSCIMGKKILVVSTSAGSMGGNPTGLWLAELAEPWYVFEAAGLEMTLASPAGGAIPIDAGSMGGDFFTADAKKFMHDGKAVGALCHSKKLSEVDLGSFDAVFIAGGHGCCVDGPQMKTAIETLYSAGKLVCADCHGPYGLIDCVKADGSPLVAGHEVTAFTNVEEEQAGAKEWVEKNCKFMETEFKAQGATFKAADPWKSHVVVSGNLVTCQNPQSAEAGARKCVEILAA